MAHVVGGYDLWFTGKAYWKAHRSVAGGEADMVPVTWTKGWRRDSNGSNFLEVWFENADEAQARSGEAGPFVVALAEAKDFEVVPRVFKEFRGLFEVEPTGTILSPNSLETRILRRVDANKSAAAAPAPAAAKKAKAKKSKMG